MFQDAPGCALAGTVIRKQEREYACRAGTPTPFYRGDTLTTDLANYDGNYTYGSGPKGTYREQTTPVGRFGVNPWGLADMHGNVFEWCEDHWHPSYDGAPRDGSAWVTGGDDRFRLVRGGSWCNNPVISEWLGFDRLDGTAPCR